MMALVLFTSILVVLCGIYLIWKFSLGSAVIRPPDAPARRREDARDWQRRFGEESLLSANFLQPTQNEILETLYVLDHLLPKWEVADPKSVELSFLNELALSFPTLCKKPCMFPLPFGECPGAVQGEEQEIAAKRERFRMSRAQSNALEQIVSGRGTPIEDAPDGLPFGRAELEADRSVLGSWPVRFAGIALLAAAVLAAVHFSNARINLKPVNEPSAEIVATDPGISQVAADPAPTPAGSPEIVNAAALVPSPAVPAVAAISAASTPLPPAAPNREKILLAQQVAASQQRAVSKYPALAVEGSEINLRFVFRYKNLVQQNSPRLLDPNWPEKLVEECAAAAGMSPKHNAFTQVLSTPR